MLSYHQLFITTKNIERTSIFNLPFRVKVECKRTTGWQCVAMEENLLKYEILGSEFDKENWLILDVNGHIICNSKERT